MVDSLLTSRRFTIRDRLHSPEFQVDLGHRRLVLVELRLQLFDERRIGFGLNDRLVLKLDVVDAVRVDVHLRQVERRECLLRGWILIVRILDVGVEVQRHQRDARELFWRDRRRTAAASTPSALRVCPPRLPPLGGRGAPCAFSPTTPAAPSAALARKSRRLMLSRSPQIVARQPCRAASREHCTRSRNRGQPTWRPGALAGENPPSDPSRPVQFRRYAGRVERLPS